MWYVSFHGGADGVNNIYVYHNHGKPHVSPDVLPTGGTNPELRELRGFEIVGKNLYVVNAYRDYSQVLAYAANASGQYEFARVVAAKDTINSILHPYDITFDHQGNCYVSSQDTNVVTGVCSTGAPLPIASDLQHKYPSPNVLLAGTIVASSIGDLPGGPIPHPPNVAMPQGLDVSFTDGTDTRVINSVCGVLCQKDLYTFRTNRGTR